MKMMDCGEIEEGSGGVKEFGEGVDVDGRDGEEEMEEVVDMVD